MYAVGSLTTRNGGLRNVCGDNVMPSQVLSFVLPCVWSPE